MHSLATSHAVASALITCHWLVSIWGRTRLMPQALDLCVQAYAGKVRDDIDHEMLKPAAWRADNYLDGDDDADDADIGLLIQGGLRFSKVPAANDHMARREDVDDYSVCQLPCGSLTALCVCALVRPDLERFICTCELC